MFVIEALTLTATGYKLIARKEVKEKPEIVSSIDRDLKIIVRRIENEK